MNDWMTASREREQDWLDLLAAIVNIDSGPGDVEGINRVYEVLSENLASSGFTDRRLPTDGPDVLLAHRPSVTADAPRLVLIGHADTVFPSGTVDRWSFSNDGERTTGPGVADMKGGLVVLLAGLALAGDTVLDRLDITVLVNGDEESGSAQSRQTIEDLAPGFDAALVFEPGRPGNVIVSSRRGAHRFELTVRGRPAHTGVNPQDGANALETAAHHVLAVQELGRSIPGATVTAVILSGGRRPNIVPEHALLTVDSRFDDAAAEEKVIEGINALVGEGPVAGTRTEVRTLNRRPAFEAASARLDELYRSVAADLGFAVEGAPSGGSSDGNFTSAAGVPTLDGLGAVGHGFHTDDEYIFSASLAERAAVTAAVLDRIAGSGL